MNRKNRSMSSAASLTSTRDDLSPKSSKKRLSLAPQPRSEFKEYVQIGFVPGEARMAGDKLQEHGDAKGAIQRAEELPELEDVPSVIRKEVKQQPRSSVDTALGPLPSGEFSTRPLLPRAITAPTAELDSQAAQ